MSYNQTNTFAIFSLNHLQDEYIFFVAYLWKIEWRRSFLSYADFLSGVPFLLSSEHLNLEYFSFNALYWYLTTLPLCLPNLFPFIIQNFINMEYPFTFYYLLCSRVSIWKCDRNYLIFFGQLFLLQLKGKSNYFNCFIVIIILNYHRINFCLEKLDKKKRKHLKCQYLINYVYHISFHLIFVIVFEP